MAAADEIQGGLLHGLGIDGDPGDPVGPQGLQLTENMILEVSPKLPRDLAKILTTDFYDDSWIELANKIE